MTEKKLKTVRRTVIVLAPRNINVTERALEWESNGKSLNRQIHRVERANPGTQAPGTLKRAATDAYLIDMELTCKGANRNDFTQFVRRYLPEAKQHFITE